MCLEILVSDTVSASFHKCSTIFPPNRTITTSILPVSHIRAPSLPLSELRPCTVIPVLHADLCAFILLVAGICVFYFSSLSFIIGRSARACWGLIFCIVFPSSCARVLYFNALIFPRVSLMSPPSFFSLRIIRNDRCGRYTSSSEEQAV